MLTNALFSMFQRGSLLVMMIFLVVYFALFCSLKSEIYDGRYRIWCAFVPFYNSLIDFKLAGMSPLFELIDVFPLISLFFDDSEKVFLVVMVWGIMRTMLFLYRDIRLVKWSLGVSGWYGVILTLDPVIAKIVLFFSRKGKNKVAKVVASVLAVSILSTSVLSPNVAYARDVSMSDYYNEIDSDKFLKRDGTSATIPANNNLKGYVTKSVIYAKANFYIKAVSELWFQGDGVLPTKIRFNKIKYGVLPAGSYDQDEKLSKDCDVFYFYITSYDSNTSDSSTDYIIKARESKDVDNDYPKCAIISEKQIALKDSKMFTLNLEVVDNNYPHDETIAFNFKKKEIKDITIDEKYLYYDRRFDYFDPNGIVGKSIAHTIVAYGMNSFWTEHSFNMGESYAHINEIDFTVFVDQKAKVDFGYEWFNTNEMIFANVDFGFEEGKTSESMVLNFDADYQGYEGHPVSSFNEDSYLQCFDESNKIAYGHKKTVKIDLSIIAKNVKAKVGTSFEGVEDTSNQCPATLKGKGTIVTKTTEEIREGAKKINRRLYIYKSLMQILGGEASGESTVAGDIGEFVFAFTGLDDYKDVSDFITYAKKGDLVSAAISVYSLLPIFGATGKTLNKSMSSGKVSEILGSINEDFADKADDVLDLANDSKKIDAGAEALMKAQRSNLQRALKEVTDEQAVSRGITDAVEDGGFRIFSHLSRRTWRESEERAFEVLNKRKDIKNLIEQPVFVNGKYVKGSARVKGSVIPDFLDEEAKKIIDVKNYKVETSKNQSTLINNVVKQLKERAKVIENFGDYDYIVYIDVYGQNIDEAGAKKIEEKIREKCAYDKLEVIMDYKK